MSTLTITNSDTEDESTDNLFPDTFYARREMPFTYSRWLNIRAWWHRLIGRRR